jgi:hypothetical protein
MYSFAFCMRKLADLEAKLEIISPEDLTVGWLGICVCLY